MEEYYLEQDSKGSPVNGSYISSSDMHSIQSSWESLAKNFVTPPTKDEMEQLTSRTMRVFEKLYTNEEMSTETVNENVVLIISVTKSASSFPLVVADAWKAYIKIIKIHNKKFTSSTCCKLVDSLSSMLSFGLTAIVSSPNDAYLNLLFFYTQRASATLAYLAGQLEETKAHDLIYLLAASRGALNMEAVSSLSSARDIQEKMDGVIAKAFCHPETRSDTIHSTLLQNFQKRDQGQKHTTLDLMTHFACCKSIGMLFITSSRLRYEGTAEVSADLESFCTLFVTTLALYPLVVTNFTVRDLIRGIVNKLLDASMKMTSGRLSGKSAVVVK